MKVRKTTKEEEDVVIEKQFFAARRFDLRRFERIFQQSRRRPDESNIRRSTSAGKAGTGAAQMEAEETGGLF